MRNPYKTHLLALKPSLWPIVLRLEPRDPDALQTKLFLLLQTDQYAAALAMIAGEGDAGDEHAFEKAYSLYRLHREDEAASVLEGMKGQDQVDDRGLQHLEAQLVRSCISNTCFHGPNRMQAYRQGSYQSAVDLYNQLLDTAEPVSIYISPCESCVCRGYIYRSYQTVTLRATLRGRGMPSMIIH